MGGLVGRRVDRWIQLLICNPLTHEEEQANGPERSTQHVGPQRLRTWPVPVTQPLASSAIFKPRNGDESGSNELFFLSLVVQNNGQTSTNQKYCP